MDDDPSRIDVLARRVRWLDRWRRPLSIAIAIGIGFAVMAQLAEVLDAKWSAFEVAGSSVFVAAVTWWAVEVGLVWSIAWWETEHDRLVRDRGLPRAELRKYKTPRG